ncbi:hypothetical protein [Pseudidiomarina insulisalsae]|nr:hypothetical protein [Pseudidiomarina insulisalsae]
MTNMFKRSLIAMALAGVSTGAMAADVTPTGTTTATNEFMLTMDQILSKSIIITLNDEYSVNDEIYLRFEGDAYVSGAPNSVDIAFGEQFCENAISGITCPAGSTAPPASASTSQDDVNKGISLDYKGMMNDPNGDTVLIYRVSQINGDNNAQTNDTTYGIDVEFGRFSFDAPTVIVQDGVIFDTFSRLNSELWPTVALGDNMFDHDVVSLPMIAETQLFEMEDQFEIEVIEPFNGTLNVWDYRRTFTDPSCNDPRTCATWTDDVIIEITNAGTWDFYVDVDPGTTNQVQYRVTSTNMFGWIESADPTTGGEVTINSACSYITHTADEMWFNCPDTSTQLDFTVDLTGAPDSAQNPKQAGDFSVEGTVWWYNYPALYADGGPNRTPEDGVLNILPFGTSGVGPVDAGMWAVNGSMTHIPYMPYSAQSTQGEVTPIGQIIYVTNITRDPGTDDILIGNDGNGDDSGNGEGPTPDNLNVNRLIWVEGIDENGNTFGPTELPVTADPGVTGIAGDVRDVLFNAGLLTSSNKVSLTITVADYPTNIQIYSAYNVNGSDRGWVQNDSIRTDLDLYRFNEILD